MSDLGQSINDYPYGVVSCLRTGQSDYEIEKPSGQYLGLMVMSYSLALV
jgi:hypothetical protein